MFVFTKKKYPENFAFLIRRILELFVHQVCRFLKKQANFQHDLLFLNVSKKTYHISHVRISQSYSNVKSSTQYFHTKMKRLADSQICISIPLSYAPIQFVQKILTLRIMSSAPLELMLKPSLDFQGELGDCFYMTANISTRKMRHICHSSPH